jgi:hypothetical protein
MRSAQDTETPKRLPGAAWVAALAVSAAILAYATMVVLNLVGLR